MMMFVISLVLAVLAVISILTSYGGQFGSWAAILAYVVLAVGNLATT